MLRLVPLAFLFFCVPMAHAEVALQFNAPGVQVPADSRVGGFRLSLFHGRNDHVQGLDFGLISLSETATFSGVSFVAGLHRVTTEMSGGASLSLINHHTGRDSGFNGAFINKLNNTEGAFNLSFLNIADGNTALDLGGVNVSQRSTAQVGFVNVTKRITAFQFGFINAAENGFLPVFPILNFPTN